MQEPKHIKHNNPSTSKQLLGTYGNLLNLRKHEIFHLKKTSYGRKKKERRTKQSLDSPQTIEANKYLPEIQVAGLHSGTVPFHSPLEVHNKDRSSDNS